MNTTLRHRGPDGAGEWIDRDAGVALGHRRLAIVDLTEEGRQPMTSASGRWVVSFNGEIYNFRSLRRELEAEGARFRGHSDTEVLLAAIERWDLDGALARFAGMFAFALWDRLERRLHLVRDRLGEKPLYYGWQGRTLLFGSELKALAAHPAWNPEIDRGALALYLRHVYVPSPRSIWAGIRKLRPGTLATFGPADPDQGRPVEIVREYWSPRQAFERGLRTPLVGSDDEIASEIEAALRRTLREEMIADVPLGAFLSGGIDSSLVVALMQSESVLPVRTFTIGFGDPSYDEAPWARSVAHHLGTDHTELYLGPEEMLAVVPELPRLYDEPFADSSQIPTHLVSRLARRHVTVCLSGDGGDELFGGYNRYFWGRRVWRAMTSVPRPLRRILARVLARFPERIARSIVAALGALLPRRLRISPQGDKLRQLAAVIDAESPEAMYRALVSVGRDAEALVASSGLEAHAAAATPQLPADADFVERMMYLDAVGYLPDDIMTKVDRASMGVSLESRAPLLDHRVAELAWRVPLRLKLRDGQGKWILRRILSRYVPAALFDRPKMGFGVPISRWLSGPLREWTAELLSPDRLRREGYLDAPAIDRRWRAHLAGRGTEPHLLWAVVMWEAWLEAGRGVRSEPESPLRTAVS